MNLYSPFDDLEATYERGHETWDDYPHSAAAFRDAVEDDAAEAQRWYVCAFSRRDAKAFRDMGMTVDEAQSWGLNAAMVQRFRALAFTKQEARAWAMAGFWPDHAFHWRRRGTPIETARLIVEHSDSPTAALAWTLVAESSDAIADMALAGRRPSEILARQARHGLLEPT